MKIHHVVPHFHPEKGGVESNVLGLARYLVGRGHEVVVHTSQRTARGGRLPPMDTIDGIAIRRYRPSIRLGYYATLLRPDVRGADIVHLHGYGFLTNDRVARAVRQSIPIVYSLHHGVAHPAPGAGGRVKRAIYDPMFGIRTLRRADAIVPASEADLGWLNARGFRGDRVRVLPTGLDSAAFEPGSPEGARERLRIREFVVFLGRIHREKSPDHLIRAVASLEEWGGSVVFVGPDGGERASLERLALQLGMDQRVVFTGEVDEAMKRNVLAGAACLVLPSFYEAQGIAIAEAWAQRRPVVVSRVGGVTYLVEDGRDGLTFPYGDIAALAGGVRKLLADRALATSLGNAGFEKARASFAWTTLAPRFEELYESVVRKRVRADGHDAV